MDHKYLIDYVTRHKPQEDIWRYTLAELGFGGVATTVGLKSAFRLKRVALKAIKRPKIGPPQLVAALTILEAVYEFSHIPGDVAPPQIVYTPAFEEADGGWRFHRAPVHYWVSLLFTLGELRCHLNGRTKQAAVVDTLIAHVNYNLSLIVGPYMPSGEGEPTDQELETVKRFLNKQVLMTCPTALTPGNQPELFAWSEEHVREQRILPIAMRWLGVAIAPYLPKAGIQLTGAHIILPNLIDMSTDDFVEIARKVGGQVFDAVISFIEELLHWRVIREGGDTAFYEPLAEIRPFELAWTEPGATDVMSA